MWHRQSTRASRNRLTAPVVRAAAGLLLVLVGAGLWALLRSPTTSWERLTAGAARYPRELGRFSGATSLSSDPQSKPLSEDPAFLSLAAEIQHAAQEQPTPANLHAYGVALVLLGRLEAAVEILETATFESSDAGIHADLGVARLALASAHERPDQLPRAAENLEEALSADANLAGAWFTKALVLEKLSMHAQARQAWQTFLTLDPQSRWADEARARLTGEPADHTGRWESLEKNIFSSEASEEELDEAVTRYAADVREAVLRTYLPAWATSRDPDLSGELRRRLWRIVGKLESNAGDRFFHTVLEEAARMSSSELETFGTAASDLSAAMGAQTAERPIAEIRPRLEQAASTLRRRGSSLALWAEFALIRLNSVMQRYQQVVRSAGDLAARAHSRGFAVLEARVRLQWAMAAFMTSRWSEAATQYDEAIRLHEHTGESALASSVHTNAAVLSRFLGNRLETWQHREQAARTLPSHRPLQTHMFLTSGAATASVEKLPLTALLFQNEVIDNARTRLSDGPLTEALIARARMLARAGRYADAARDLDEASRLIGTIASEAMRHRFERAWLLGSSEVRLAEDPAGAAADAARAEEIIAATNEPARLAEAALLRGRALSRLGRIGEARRAVDRGLTAFEAGLRSIDPRDPSRVAALEPVWDLYAEATRFSLIRGHEDLAVAFDTYERGRARSLLDLREERPIRLDEARQRLRPDEGLLLIDQSSQDLVTFWIDRETVNVAREPLRQGDLDRLVASHRRSIELGQRRSPASARLFDLSIRPHLDHVRKRRVAAVIGDGAWTRVAWPTLWDSTTGAELVSTVAVVISPSATVALTRRETRVSQSPRAVVVSASEAGDESPLPGARLEAMEVADVYDGEMLEGDSATASRVLDLGRSAEVLHVSSHARSAEAYPHLAHLVLAGSDGDERLFVGDIIAADLSSLKVVVLAACSTAGRSTVRGEGGVGVAWAFLTAGAASVIATLEDIEDEPARRFFPAIHKRIKAGQSPAEALREVQREWALTGEAPRMWANVAVFGSL